MNKQAHEPMQRHQGAAIDNCPYSIQYTESVGLRWLETSGNSKTDSYADPPPQ